MLWICDSVFMARMILAEQRQVEQVISKKLVLTIGGKEARKTKMGKLHSFI